MLYIRGRHTYYRTIEVLVTKGLVVQNYDPDNRRASVSMLKKSGEKQIKVFLNGMSYSEVKLLENSINSINNLINTIEERNK